MMVRDNKREHFLNPIGYSFCDDLKDNISQTNGHIVRGKGWGLNFGNKSNISVIDTTRITLMIKDVESKLKNILTNDVPIILKKES